MALGTQEGCDPWLFAVWQSHCDVRVWREETACFRNWESLQEYTKGLECFQTINVSAAKRIENFRKIVPVVILPIVVAELCAPVLHQPTSHRFRDVEIAVAFD